MCEITFAKMSDGSYGIFDGYDPNNKPLYIMVGDFVDIEILSDQAFTLVDVEILDIDHINSRMSVRSHKTGTISTIYTNAIKSITRMTYDLKRRATRDHNSEPDMVNHPPHYISETGLEVIDVIEAFTFDLKGIEAVDTAQILRYVCRWKKKNGLQDLKKAQWFINHLIEHLEKLEKENK